MTRMSLCQYRNLNFQMTLKFGIWALKIKYCQFCFNEDPVFSGQIECVSFAFFIGKCFNSKVISVY